MARLSYEAIMGVSIGAPVILFIFLGDFLDLDERLVAVGNSLAIAGLIRSFIYGGLMAASAITISYILKQANEQQQ